MQGVRFDTPDPGEPDKYDLDYDIEVDTEPEPYISYSAETPRSAHTYEEMLDSDWVDEPLRDLLEARINDLRR